MYLGLACILGTATAAVAADPGSEDPNNWPQYNRTTNAWRYSPLDQINKGNINGLSVAGSRMAATSPWASKRRPWRSTA
jgi:alcohol dehydrogenase (cytochrome c)